MLFRGSRFKKQRIRYNCALRHQHKASSPSKRSIRKNNFYSQATFFKALIPQVVNSLPLKLLQILPFIIIANSSVLYSD